MKNVLITGGTGLIGKHLSNKLRASGYNVSLLSRRTADSAGFRVYRWDPDSGTIDPEAITMADYIIHLAGAGLGDSRWTERRKKEIIDSRINSAALILDILKKSGKRPEAFISASGAGYYGTLTTERIHAETDDPGTDFTGEVCRRWEEAAGNIGSLGIRTVILRTGIVLSGKGGVLQKMALPARFGIGSPLGSGRQYLPWIHIDDICGLYIKAVEDHSMRGAYNAAAPEHVTNSQFMRTVSKVMGRPFFFPAIPSFVFRILFGEMSSILLKGSRVSSEKIISSGYSFRYPELSTALKSLA